MSILAAFPADLLEIAAKVTLLLVLTAAIDLLVMRRNASAAARHLLWTLATGAILLLPAIQLLVPEWRVPVLDARVARLVGDRQADVDAGTTGMHVPDASTADAHSAAEFPVAASSSVPAPAAGSTDDKAVGIRPVADGASTASLTMPTSAGPAMPWGTMILGAYLSGVLLLLARMLGERLAVRRIERDATPVADGDWSSTLRAIARSLGIRRPVSLLRSAAPTVPLTWGTLHPTVLLPSTAEQWPAARREAVLLHELAHVARHDCLVQTLAAVACALYWPHPGVWFAARRLRVERELACDDQALARGVRPRDYAGHLLEVARGFRDSRQPGVLAVSMATPSNLEARLRAVVDGRRRRGAPSTRTKVLAGSIVAALLLPLGAVWAVAAEDAPAGQDVVAVNEEADRIPASIADERDSGAVVTGNSEGMKADPGGIAAPTSTVPDTIGTQPAPAPGPRRDSTTSSALYQLQGGTWRIIVTGNESGNGAATAQVILLTPGMNTFVIPLDSMEGLPLDVLKSGSTSVSFRLRRDPGPLAFEGSFTNGRGSGSFTHTPDAKFSDELVRRGMQRPSSMQLFTLAIHGASLAYLDELARLGYAVPTTEDLVRATLSSADAEYAREMAELGYRAGTLRALVSLSNSGVDPKYVRQLAQLGYRELPAMTLVRMRNQGLSAEVISKANQRAGQTLPVETLIRMRRSTDAEAGESEEESDSPARARPSDISSTRPVEDGARPARPVTDTPRRGRWIIVGTNPADLTMELQWDDDTQWRRRIPLAAFTGLSPDALSSAAGAPVVFRLEQDAGRMDFEGTFRNNRGTGDFRFEPKREFVATLRSLGITEIGDMTDHDLKNLTYGGYSADVVRQLKALDFPAISRRELVEMAIFFVTPEYAKTMQEHAVVGANTVRGIVDLRHGGVPADYVRELSSLGYRNLTVEQVHSLARHGVTGAFIRSTSAGENRQLTVEELLERRTRALDSVRARRR